MLPPDVLPQCFVRAAARNRTALAPVNAWGSLLPRLLLKRVAAQKALPFEPLVPNAETVEAMKAARRGAVTKAGKPAALLASLNADGYYTTRFKRDYKREKAGRHGTSWIPS